MANETIITVIGNLTADPELRYTQTGMAVVNFTIASTPRTFNRTTNEWDDGEALFLRSSVWRDFAEHVAGTLTKGMRVIATGRLKQRSYETKEGEKRTSIELEVDEIGPSLRYATASVMRTQANVTGTQQRNQQAQQGGGAWADQQVAQQVNGAWPGQPQAQQVNGAYQQPPAAVPPVQQGPPQPQYTPQQQVQQEPEAWNYDGETPF